MAYDVLATFGDVLKLSSFSYFFTCLTVSDTTLGHQFRELTKGQNHYCFLSLSVQGKASYKGVCANSVQGEPHFVQGGPPYKGDQNVRCAKKYKMVPLSIQCGIRCSEQTEVESGTSMADLDTSDVFFELTTNANVLLPTNEVL